MPGGSKTVRSPSQRLMQALETAYDGLRGRLPGPAGPFTGFLEPLPALRDGDAETGRQIYRGQFAFAGHTLKCHPADAFASTHMPSAWRDELLGFSWLADLDAAGLALYRAFARNMFGIWAAREEASPLTVTSNRLLAFSRHGAFLLNGAPATFEAEFLRRAGQDVRRLTQMRVKTPADALLQSAAVLAASLSFAGSGQLRDEALARTGAAAAAAILPDGGAVDRSPRSLAAMLAILVPLRERLERRRIAVPHDFHAAIERAMPMLRMLCHGDGGLAVFHGTDDTARATVQALMDRDAVGGRPLTHAVHAGYARLSQGSATVVADCGATAVCDSPLAFEFSDGPQRLVVSCGFPLHASPAWFTAARGPAAHSTLEIQNASERALDSFFLRRGKSRPPGAVTAEVIASPHGTLMKARSEAHLAALGLVHHRELFLAFEGQDFRGEDRLERHDPMERGWPEVQFALRFHLHPTLKVEAGRAGASLQLTLPGGGVWQFTARGGVLRLEDSLFLATGGAAQPCRQIVIRGIAGRPDIINWAFRKLDA